MACPSFHSRALLLSLSTPASFSFLASFPRLMGKAGHRGCSGSASDHCGVCQVSLPAWHSQAQELFHPTANKVPGNSRVSWARAQRTSGICDQVTERSHAQAELSGKCNCDGWCECKPLCIPLHAKYQHIYAPSFPSYHFTGHDVFPHHYIRS